MFLVFFTITFYNDSVKFYLGGLSMRRIISMIVLWSIIISFIPVISFATNEYELNKIIEFEELMM